MNKGHVKFGPAGNSEKFYSEGHKSSTEMPEWLHKMGLQAYEYSCTRGVRIGQGTARKIGESARDMGISLSIHAPYYINLANPDSKAKQRNIKYILDSLKAAQWMGAARVVFHPGTEGKLSRSSAMETAMSVLCEVIKEARFFLDKGIYLCPETMGKKGQLGTISEILELCQLDQSLMPALDFGHMYALNQGFTDARKSMADILDQVHNAFSDDRSENLHIHFSRIEFTNAGEKKHWTYAHSQFGPDFDELAGLLVERGLSGIVICESRGTMAEDAAVLMDIYKEQLSLFNN